MGFSLNKEHQQFQKKIRDFLRKELEPHVREIEGAAKFPMEFYRLLAENKLLALNFPKKYGGQEADVVTCAILIHEMAKLSSGVAGTVTTAGMTAPALLLKAGTNAQKEKYLHGVATGDTITSFAITEPNCGSDITNLATQAVAEGDSYRINGTKVFITNGSVANIFLIVARTGPLRKEFSVFLVEQDRPGFSVSKKFQKLGWWCQDTTEICLDDVVVPKENLVGPEGGGLLDAMTSIGFTRVLLAATGLGVAEATLEHAISHTKETVQIGKPLIRQQAVRSALARMAVDIEAGHYLVYGAASMMDRGARHRKEAAMAKFYATELAKRVTRETLRLYGVEGFSRTHQAAVFFADTPVFTIADGTSEIQLENIAREMGLLKSGEMGL
jgi:alkylation response protein AidB-like acyl-CoA dehydrogenase